METYKNLGRDSGVKYYEVGDDFITIHFDNGGRYLYDYNSTGNYNVEEMKRLALAGKGLCTFINKHVKYKYAQKLR